MYSYEKQKGKTAVSLHLMNPCDASLEGFQKPFYQGLGLLEGEKGRKPVPSELEYEVR